MGDNYYAKHLAKVNDVKGVTATSDIVNEQGQLVLPAGATIDRPATEKIIRFKLLKPLENTIAIESQLDTNALYEELERFFLDDPGLATVWAKYNDQEQTMARCEALCRHSILAQKLTVLALEYEHLFYESLFCAWFGCYMLVIKGADESTLNKAFISGALHDIGMLHLNPEFLDSKRKLSAEEWRQVQSHPIIGEQILKNIENIDKDIARIVAEHHECIDATGYPAGKISKQIHPVAQVLHLLDSVWAIYTKHFKPRGRTIRDTTPIIQMNQHFRHNENANPLVTILHCSEASMTCCAPPQLMETLIKNVEDKIHYILAFIESCDLIGEKLGYQHGEKKLLGLQNIIIHIHISLNQSGLVNLAYVRWLQQVREEQLAHALREVEDASLMLTEIMFHASKLKVALEQLIDNCGKENQRSVLQEVLDQLNNLEKPLLSPDLAQFIPDSEWSQEKTTTSQAF